MKQNSLYKELKITEVVSNWDDAKKKMDEYIQNGYIELSLKGEKNSEWELCGIKVEVKPLLRSFSYDKVINIKKGENKLRG